MASSSKQDRTDASDFRNAFSYDPVVGEIKWKIDAGQNGRAGNVAGSFTAKGYRQVVLNRKSYLAHRVAWLLHHGSWPTRQLDHINENKADNRLVNLRLATNTQNTCNRGKNINNTSGFKGVSWHKRVGRWQAQIGVGRDTGRRTICLGYFNTPEEAYAAYCVAAAKYHGEFANMGAVQ